MSKSPLFQFTPQINMIIASNLDKQEVDELSTDMMVKNIITSITHYDLTIIQDCAESIFGSRIAAQISTYSSELKLLGSLLYYGTTLYAGTMQFLLSAFCG